MKRHLLFSALFMAALLLSSPAAPAKTHHHKQHVDADEISFPTGTFYETPTDSGFYTENGVRLYFEMQTDDDIKNDILVVKKMNSFSVYGDDTYLVHFVGLGGDGRHQYSCRFSGIFEQKTKKKELTLVDSYKKLGCNLTVTAHKDWLDVYAPAQPYELSCRQFCDNEYPLSFSYNYPHKKSNKHHQH